jgi:hypothetical protein
VLVVLEAELEASPTPPRRAQEDRDRHQDLPLRQVRRPELDRLVDVQEAERLEDGRVTTATLERPAREEFFDVEEAHIVTDDPDVALCGTVVAGEPWVEGWPPCRACADAMGAGDAYR